MQSCVTVLSLTLFAFLSRNRSKGSFQYLLACYFLTLYINYLIFFIGLMSVDLVIHPFNTHEDCR